MLVHKKVILDGIEYEHYHIKKIEWDLDSLIIGVMVVYYDDENKHAAKIKTHYFKSNIEGEVDVNWLIQQVKIIHE